MPDSSIFLHIEAGAHSGAFGCNLMPTPTDAQCKAGNYKLGRITLYGLSIAIEQPRGTYRTGMGTDGKRWTSRMAAHYGYFERTTGADGDGVDCFVGFYPQSECAYVVNQNIDGQFDEHKCLIGFPDKESARRAYLDSYDRGWPGLASIVPASISQLKWWLKHGNMKQPLKPDHLPPEGLEMTRRTQWSAEALPYDQTLDQLLYDIRRSDGGDSLLLDSVSLADILEDSDGALAFDALVTPYASLERKMGVLQRVMERSAMAVKPVAMQITEPFTQRGVANVAVLFELTDGQTVSIYFHNPDVTPKKMAGTDEVISWKWLLNKKDITIVVAPERGEDLNINEVARRIMKLAEKNSAAFIRANGKRAERMAAIGGLKTEITGLEAELKSAQHELEVVQIEAEDRATAVSRQIAALIEEQDRAFKLLEAEKAFGLGADTVKLEALMNQYDDLADKIRSLRGEAAEGHSSWATWKALRDAEEARNSPSLLIKTAIANALSQTDGKVETSDALVWALSKSSLNKMVASNNKDGEKPFQKERILAIQSIQAIAKTAVSPVVRPDDNNSPEIEAIFEYFSTFETGGKTYKVRLLCKKFVKDSSADDKMHSLKLDGVPADQGVPDGLLISLEIIGDVAELGNPDLSLPPSAEGKDTLAKVEVEVKPTEIDPEIRREMDDELTYARQGKFSSSYLADRRSGDLAAFLASYEDERVAHEAALASAWEGRSQTEANTPIAIVDEPVAPVVPVDVGSPSKDADTAYLKSLIDGTTDMFAADIFDKLEPLFATYESDADMMALLTQASEAYVASSVTAAKAALAAM